MSNLHQVHSGVLKQRLAAYSSHLQTMLAGVVASFADATNPLRFTNTATGLRELFRELLAEIAPDTKIQNCSWFVPDPSSQTGFTRRHRTLFAVYSYLDPKLFPTNLVADVDDLATDIADHVEKLSAFTHVTKLSLAKTEQEATPVFDSTLALFLQLFDAIDSAREHLRDALESTLSRDLALLFTEEFFDDLDILSTHTRPRDAEDIRVQVTEIGQETIEFSGSGRVLCDLQVWLGRRLSSR